MKRLSNLSLVLMLLGFLLLGLNWSMNGFSELVFLSGWISLSVGILFSVIAIVQKEEGVLKFIPLFSYFFVLIIMTWFEPFQFVRLITWLKNI